MNKLKLVKTIINAALFVFVIFVGLFIFFSGKRDFKGWRLLVVKSGSMEPTIKTGSLIFVKREADYKKGNIITYGSLVQSDSLITHRIVEEVEREDGKYFKTRGDSNATEDVNLVPAKKVIGKYKFIIPYLGYAIGFAKTQVGLILLIVIPISLIIYSEILNIKKEVQLLLNKRKKKDK